MKKRLAALATCWLMLAPVISGASEVDDIQSEGGKWAAYYRSGDLEGLMSLYMDDAIVALHGQPALFGKQAVRDYFAPRLGKAETTFELQYELRETHGDIAYIISKYWLRATSLETGEVYRDAGRSLLVYKRHEGRWKIAADIDQSTPDVDWPSPGGLQ
ncbi:MAG: YybH family protein [Steroidobacteraceae bacterium]